MAKLKNIKAVKEMLGGEHKTQTKKTISFADKVFVKREVGETWVDDKNQKWEQRNGYKVKFINLLFVENINILNKKYYIFFIILIFIIWSFHPTIGFTTLFEPLKNLLN